MKFLKENVFGLASFFALVAISFYFYPRLPESVATKFDFNGHPTQYSSRAFVTTFLPAIQLFLIGLVGILVNASPREFSMPNSRKAMDVAVAGCGLLLLGIHFGLLVDPGGKATFVRCFSFGIALFLVVVGNVLGKTERNFFLGVRVPWTIASEANWRATHRFTGKMMVLFGLALLGLTFIHSSLPVAILAILIPTLSPVVYSYSYYRKYELRVDG